MTTRDNVLFEFDAPGQPRISYLICSIPRSGSNLLCSLLWETGVAGAPTELFHPDFMQMLRRRWGVDTTEAYVQQLLARKTSPNGVFGAKVHWGQYHPLFGTTDPRKVLPNVRLIHISRRDHLRQAVSWVRALQTLRWQSGHDERPERSTEYDPDHITRKLGRIAREEAAWRSLFDDHGIEPHEIVYEDLVADRDGTVRAALEFIGADPPADLGAGAPPLERQADALSEQWLERYRAEVPQS